MRKKKKLIYLFLIFMAVSCSRPAVTSEVSPTLTSIPSLTETATPTATREKTPTMISPTQTLAPTKEKMPTFLPTLLPSLAEKQVLELLKTNANCDLPCWWGLEPGKTSYEDANRLLSPLSIREPYTQDDVTQHAWINYAFQVPESLSVIKELRMDMRFKQSVLQYTEVIALQWDTYTLPSLLRKYGPPEEVRLHTLNSPPSIPPPFALFLFYPQKGMLAYFASHQEKNEIKDTGNMIRGCFSTSASLYLWSPREQLTLKEEAENMSVVILSEEQNLTLPIDKATGLDIQHFYQTYKDIKTTPCIQTAKNLWPNP